MATATVKVYSKSGNTPITKRGGAFLDLLVDKKIDACCPGDAYRKVLRLIRDTEHGHDGHFYMPTWPNQNTRSGFVYLGSLGTNCIGRDHCEVCGVKNCE